MNFLRLFKKYCELENKCETLEQQLKESCFIRNALENSLRLTRKELDATRAKLQSPSPAANPPAAPRPQKVPHCVGCPDHVRFNNVGKYAHQCNKVVRPISGNDARTSPKWCPLRGKEQA